MGVKGLAIVAVLWILLQAPLAVAAQTGNHAGAKPQTSSSSSAEPQSSGTENEGVARDLQPPHITVANPPAPAPAPWSLHEQIAWAANLVLVLLGYVGIMMAVSLLKKITRQTAYAETAADAAATDIPPPRKEPFARRAGTKLVFTKGAKSACPWSIALSRGSSQTPPTELVITSTWE